MVNPASATNTERMKSLPTISGSIHSRLQGYIALSTKETFSTKSLTKQRQEEEMEKRYHGTGKVASQVGMFLTRFNHYQTSQAYTDIDGSSVYIIEPEIHNHYGFDAVIGRNITSTILRATYLKEGSGLCSARTLLKWAGDELRGFKKIMTLMPEAEKAKIISKDNTGEFDYCSGKTRTDLYQFLLASMQHWDYYNGPSGMNPPTMLPDGPSGMNPPTTLPNATTINTIPSPGEDTSINGASVSSTVGYSSTKTNDADIVSGSDRNCKTISPLTTNETDIETVSSDKAKEMLSELFEKLGPAKDKFLPAGWFTFCFRGPMVSKQFRLDVLKINENFGNCGQAAFRKEEKKEKARQRDFHTAGLGDVRSLSYGATSHKELAVIAQQKQKLGHMALVANVAKHSMVLQSKQDCLKTLQHMIGQEMLLRMNDEARSHMRIANKLLEEIEQEEKVIIDLSNDDVNDSAANQVDLFLKRGAEAMGLNTNENIKKKLFQNNVDSSPEDE